MTTENLSNEPLCSVALNRSPEPLRRGYPQTSNWETVCKDEHGGQTAMNLDPVLVHLLELGAPANVFVPLEARHRRWNVDAYSLLTVSRLRPFARRRFSTRRPFLLLMRTRKPCVRFLCRVFG
jgi:hypothetical protein